MKRSHHTARRARAGRLNALGGASILVLAYWVCALPGAAQAQSLQGSPDVVSGQATIETALNLTDITVGSRETVIDWKVFIQGPPTGPPVDVLPAGTTTTFRRDEGVQGERYTVFNRLLPVSQNSNIFDRRVEINGTVRAVDGGAIWFYSPAGIVVGPDAAFDVASLVLTANNIDTSEGPFGPNGEIRFRGESGSSGLVEIMPGASISAKSPQSAYVGIVAPFIRQGGTVETTGSIAYVAAEQANITFNAGLVDISVTQGTTNAQGIVHTGSSGGSSPQGEGGARQLAIVAVPKNEALTMLLSGTFGYAPAEGASADGGAIVLSAGHGFGFDDGEAPAGLGSIEINGSRYTSRLDASADGTVNILPRVEETVEFRSAANLQAGNAVNFRVGSDTKILANGDLGVSAGSIRIDAGAEDVPGGELSVGGSLDLMATDRILVNMPAYGASVTAASGDIAIGANGKLGRRGVTDTVTLVNLDPEGRSFIGGTGQEGEYSLDGDELRRVFADDSISIALESPADAIIGDLELSFGAEGNIGEGGSLEIESSGRVGVTGAVLLSTAGDDDTFLISADRIEVNTNAGSIAMRNDDGTGAGVLDLKADRIAVASSDTLTRLETAASAGEISGMLDQPSGGTSEDGSLVAGTIRAEVADAFLVQNAGTSDDFADRRGFSASTLAIATASSGTIVAINGVTINEQGELAAGLATAATVTINGTAATGPGQFDPLSSINGCKIGADCTPAPAPTPVPPEIKPSLYLTSSQIRGTVEDVAPKVETTIRIEMGESAPVVAVPAGEEDSVASDTEKRAAETRVAAVAELAARANDSSGEEPAKEAEDGSSRDGRGLPGLAVRESAEDSSLRLVDEPVTGVGNDDLWEGHCREESSPCGHGGTRR